MDRTTQKRGFTLIELLVVIAIIMILAAILFPVFEQAQQNAIRASCQSNEKQLGLAIQQYAGDYDEHFVNARGASNDFAGWAGPLSPYVKSTGNNSVFRCPNDITVSLVAGSYPCSYGFNFNLASLHMSKMTSPAKTVMLIETTQNVVALDDVTELKSPFVDGDGRGGSANGHQGTSFAIGKPGYHPPPSLYGYWNGGPAHFDGANYLMADGHVKYYQPDQVGVGAQALIATADVQGGYFGNVDGVCDYYCKASGVQSDKRQVTFSY